MPTGLTVVNFPLAAPPQDKKADFYFIEKEDPDQALALIKELCATRLPQSFHLDPRGYSGNDADAPRTGRRGQPECRIADAA